MIINSRFLLFSCLFCIGLTNTAQADDRSQPVHWAQAALFGTGWYQVEDNRSVWALRVSPRQSLRDSAYHSDGTRDIGVEILYTGTLGFHDIDGQESEAFGTASFTPSIELEIPVTEAWYLRPFVDLGYGYNWDTSEGAWIWHLGIKSRYRIEARDATWNFLANIYHAGYDAELTGSDSLGGLLLGIEVSHRLFKAKYYNGELDAHWHLTYTTLTEELSFQRPEEIGGTDDIDDVFEFGLAFSPSGRQFDFGFWRPHRLGIGLQVSPSGDYVAIKFNSRSWFTR